MQQKREPFRQRASRDTKSFRNSSKWFWGCEVVGGAVFGLGGGFGGFLSIPTNSTPLQQFAYPAIGAAIGLIVGLAITYGLILLVNLIRAPYRQLDEVYRRTQSSAVIESLDLKGALSESKVSWGFWHAGGRAVMDGAIQENKPSSLRKLILLKPDSTNDVFQFQVKLAGRASPEGIRQEIAEIERTASIAKSYGVIPLYHTEYLTYTFTIFDTTPNDGNKDNPTPNSENAWVVVQPIEPETRRKPIDWIHWVVRNKGDTKDQFEAYYRLFLQIEKKLEGRNSEPTV